MSVHIDSDNDADAVTPSAKSYTRQSVPLSLEESFLTETDACTMHEEDVSTVTSRILELFPQTA